MATKLKTFGYQRQAHRRTIDPSEEVTASFELSGEKLNARIISMSNHGLVGLSKHTAFKEMQQDTEVFVDLLISSPSLIKDLLIKAIVLLRIQYVDETSIKFIFNSEIESTRAQLWQLGYELDHPVEFSQLKANIKTTEIPKIPGRGHYTEASRLERVKFIKSQTKKDLPVFDKFNLVAERLSSNIENLIGSVEIPVGLAGPLLFNGPKARGMIYVPMATTEGALVASATRGATAITHSGGITTRVMNQQMIRVPLFRFQNLDSSIAFSRWLTDHFNEIKNATQKVSQFSNLIKIEPLVGGSTVNVRFVFETGDAAGQNMTTSCTWHACLWILKQIKIIKLFELEHFMIEGNVSGDKKVNASSFLDGRGVRVIAECFIDEENIERFLKVSSFNLEKAYHLMAFGSTKIGMVGMNVNIANMIGAIFTATGQDIGSVHESSLGILNVEAMKGGAYVSLLLPSLIIGTVGGGTGLPDQNQYLQLIDCSGSGKASRLAEIIAGYCLALDVSTLAALATGQFATAHEKMGRNRPIKHLSQAELTPDFFNKIMAQHPIQRQLHIESLEFLAEFDGGSSIVTELTSRRLSKFMGLKPMRLNLGDQNLDVVVKIKAQDSEVILMLNSIAAMCHPTLAKSFNAHQHDLGFKHSHRRELAIYRQTDERFLEHSPVCYATFEQAEREICLLVLEDISSLACYNSVDMPQLWQDEEIKATIYGLASLHSIWWKRDQELAAKDWLDPPMNTERMLKMRDLWEALGAHAAREFPEWYSLDLLDAHQNRIVSMQEWWQELDMQPKTLIHNDFNPRNIAMRKSSDSLRLCAYDWELAMIHVPQHDLAEFFLFNSHLVKTEADLFKWVDLHRTLLAAQTHDDIPQQPWLRGFSLSVQDLMVNRVGLYIMAHTLHHYKFIQTLIANGSRLLEMTKNW